MWETRSSMQKWILYLIISMWFVPVLAADQQPYLHYPTGHISLDDVYNVLSPKRKALRACHQQYLSHIPGAFDELSLQFQIDPEGKAIPFAQESTQKPKQEAVNCIKSVIRSVEFPRPKMGIVFVLFESDFQNTTKVSQENNPLSRNSLRLIPFVPQKMVRAMIEMYMPYYKRCFLQAPKNKRPMRIELSWTINANGLTENIHSTTKPKDHKVLHCITKVTKEHRYPTGYAPTDVHRDFEIK